MLITVCHPHGTFPLLVSAPPYLLKLPYCPFIVITVRDCFHRIRRDRAAVSQFIRDNRQRAVSEIAGTGTTSAGTNVSLVLLQPAGNGRAQNGGTFILFKVRF